MNDRQRLEAIVDVVRRYLPPDGISREEAMSQIIGLVDPLPAQPEQEPELVAVIGNWGRVERVDGVYPQIGDRMYSAPPSKLWVSLTDEEMQQTCYQTFSLDPYIIARAIEAKLKEKNT
jgi:hypothetical protein